MDMKMFPEMTEKMNMLLMDIIAALGQLPVEATRIYIWIRRRGGYGLGSGSG